jgi:hypothetical protein
MTDIFSGLKSMSFIDISTLSTTMPYIFWAVLLSLLFFVLLKLSTHRIYIEKLLKVQGGYVVRGSRYKLMFDKDNKQEFLKPMFGGGRLPSFPTECFLKTKGIPFFGVQRELSLIMPNKYSPIVSLPPGQILKVPIKRFFFLDEKTKFIKKFKRGDLAYFLSLYAPFIVILGAFVAWIFAIFLDYKNTDLVVSKFKELVNILENIIK